MQVRDVSGATATATVTISASLALTPPSASATPHGTIPFTATGGAPPYSFSLASNASGGSVSAAGLYTAGATPNSVDAVRVTDSAGASITAVVTVGGGVKITPATPEVASHGTVAFTASGGSGSGYTWSLVTNASGGTIDPQTGAYAAGAGSSAVDKVRVVDSLGNSATVSVSRRWWSRDLRPPIRRRPRAARLPSPPSAARTSTTGRLTNLSGGSIDAATGAYTAGNTGGVTDVVKVADTNGNSATVNVTVGPSLTITPVTTTAVSGTYVAYAAAGGSGGYVYSFDTNVSGGSIRQDGIYQAGTVKGDDHIRLVDSVGNVALAVVGVSPAPVAPTPSPSNPTYVPPTFKPGSGNSNDCSCHVVGGAPHAPGTLAGLAGLALGLALLARRRR